MAEGRRTGRLTLGPGYSTRTSKRIKEEQYGRFLDDHREEIINELKNAGYKVTLPRERAVARAGVNKAHGIPREGPKKEPSEWNMYVARNMRAVMDEYGISPQEAMGILADDWKQRHGAPVGAGRAAPKKRKVKRIARRM